MTKREVLVPTDLEQMLYKSLKVMPCKCIYAWKTGPYDAKAQDTLEGRYKVKECTACAACEAYEKKYGVTP